MAWWQAANCGTVLGAVGEELSDAKEGTEVRHEIRK